MSELDNIKERFEKVYIVADDQTHIVLSHLKKDIGWLLYELTSQKKELSDADIISEWNSAGGTVHGPNVETVAMTQSNYLKFRRGL